MRMYLTTTIIYVICGSVVETSKPCTPTLPLGLPPFRKLPIIPCDEWWGVQLLETLIEAFILINKSVRATKLLESSCDKS